MPGHSFSSVAMVYDPMVWFIFGRNLQRAQQANLVYLTNQAHILIIGGGSGWILEQVLKSTKQSKIVYLEASASMIRKAQTRNQHIQSDNFIEYRLGTEASISAQEKFTFIIANFFLDLFGPTELNQVLGKLNAILVPGGKWLVTDFVLPSAPTKWKSWAASLLFKSMYTFFRITCKISASTLPNWEYNLQQVDAAELKSTYFYHALIKTVVLQKTVREAIQ